MDTKLARQWKEEGYVVVPGVYDADRTAHLLEISERILARWRRESPQTGQPGGDRDAIVMRHLNHPGYFGNGEGGFSEVMNVVADDRVLEICRSILGQEPLFRCTSLFMNPLDTSDDGNWHRDTQHTYPDEEEEKQVIANSDREGTGVQLQVALLPSDALQYVPGSHLRWDTPEEYSIRRADDMANNRANTMPGSVRIALEPGDAAAFNSHGLHRGRRHADIPRRTLMLTYTKTPRHVFDKYSNQPWFDTPGYLDGLKPETRASFEPFVAAYGEQWRRKAEA